MARNLILALIILPLVAGCGPDPALAQFNAGNEEYYKGVYYSAINAFDRAIAMSPDLCEAYNNRGLAYQARGNPDHALSDYGKAIECYDRNRKQTPTPAQAAAPYNNRGTLYAQRSDYAPALQDFGEAIQRQPDFGKAYYNRGLIYLEQHNYDDALEDFDRALELSFRISALPTRIDATPSGFLSSPAFQQMRQEQADTSIRAGRAEILYARGRLYYARGAYERAIADFDEALGLDTARDIAADVLGSRGVALQDTGDYAGALGDFSQAIAILSARLTPAPGPNIDPVNPRPENAAQLASQYRAGLAEACYRRGRVYLAQGDVASAIADFERAFELGDGLEQQAAVKRELDVLRGALPFFVASPAPAAPAGPGAAATAAPPPPSPARTPAASSAAYSPTPFDIPPVSAVRSAGTSAPAAPSLGAPFVAYTPLPSETRVIFEPDTNTSACQGKPLSQWQSPGGLAAGSSPASGSPAPATQPGAGAVPGCPEIANTWVYGSPGFGERLPVPPVPGAQARCDSGTPGDPRVVEIRVAGAETVTTSLGVFQAIRVDASQGYEWYGATDRYGAYVPHVQDQHRASEWWVCGLGRVRIRLSYDYDGGSAAPVHKSSVTDLVSLDRYAFYESAVRVILADMQLAGSSEAYRARASDPDVAEALRRWDAGTRVANINRFERKVIDQRWYVVYAGTATGVNGMEIGLR